MVRALLPSGLFARIAPLPLLHLVPVLVEEKQIVIAVAHLLQLVLVLLKIEPGVAEVEVTSAPVEEKTERSRSCWAPQVAEVEVKTKTLQATTAQAVQAEAETVEAQVLTLVRQELTVSVEAVAEAVKTAQQKAVQVVQEL